MNWRETSPGSLFGSFGCSSSGSRTPPGSELGSTEIESDEDDFIAELTRQMADYMLGEEDDDKPTPNCASLNAKWSDRDLGSKHHHGERAIMSSHKPSTVSAHLKSPKADNKTEAIHVFDDQLKNQEHMERQGWAGWGRRGMVSESTQQHFENRGGATGRRVCHQQVGGSAMRAIFLGKSGSKSGSSGTGVFLPSATSSSPESRKKSGCSTVLVPTRVLETLRLHFDNPSRGSTAHHLHHFNQQDALMAGGYDTNWQQKRQSLTQTGHEVGLPSEWTY